MSPGALAATATWNKDARNSQDYAKCQGKTFKLFLRVNGAPVLPKGMTIFLEPFVNHQHFRLKQEYTTVKVALLLPLQNGMQN